MQSMDDREHPYREQGISQHIENYNWVVNSAMGGASAWAEYPGLRKLTLENDQAQTEYGIDSDAWDEPGRGSWSCLFWCDAFEEKNEGEFGEC
jgi:hypothetical protein